MSDQSITLMARQWLEKNTKLNRQQRSALASVTPALSSLFSSSGQSFIGVSGPPGTGKSTLCHMLANTIEMLGRTAVVVSLDDYYLPAARRAQLAREQHPLFANRGVPGTHDLSLLLEHLDQLEAEESPEILIPCFDKAKDDRCPDSRILALSGVPDVVFLEGWIVGMPAPAKESLLKPINQLEAEQDNDGSWREAVRSASAHYHVELDRRLDQIWYIQPPGWEEVINWRWDQEQQLVSSIRHLQDRHAVAKFLATYERLCLHMQQSASQWADVIIQLDQNHNPRVEIQ